MRPISYKPKSLFNLVNQTSDFQSVVAVLIPRVINNPPVIRFSHLVECLDSLNRFLHDAEIQTINTHQIVPVITKVIPRMINDKNFDGVWSEIN